MAKYKASINNIILTNYLRFILIRNNEITFDIDLFTIGDLTHASFVLPEGRLDQFIKLNESFTSYKIADIDSGEVLARELSKKAKLLRILAEQQLETDLKSEESRSSLFDFYEGIRALINDIKISDCADEYAQTITYGLFLAIMNSKNLLTRENAAYAVPQGVGIIRKVFANIAADLPSNLTWIIDEVIEVLNASNMPLILSQIDKRGRKTAIHFLLL
jgi:hypothetical protein